MEKTVRKHSEMVESIRELSDGLMELEAKLKVTQQTNVLTTVQLSKRSNQ